MKSWVHWCSTSLRDMVVSHKKRRLLHFYEKGQYKQMASLFRSEKDYVSVKFDQFPFLYYMVSEGNKEAVLALLKSVSFRNYLLFDEKNPLKCNSLVFAYLENKNEGFSLAIANSEGQNILHMAAIYKRREAFFEGLKKKASINLADNYGNTPLHYSCRAGEVQMVQALVAGKAERLANLVHLYPIHMAIQSNKPEVVQIIKTDLWDKYPLFHPVHSAARIGAQQILRQLFNKEATLINQRDFRSMTPLHHAVATQNYESVEYLLKQKGVLVNLADEFGNTPLHIAFMRDDIESASRLIEAKADLDLLNNDHLAPVDLGLDSNNPHMKAYVKSLVPRSKRLTDWRTRL